MNAPENTLSRLALAAAAQPLHTVAPGQALALRPRRAGELCIERGAAWITFDVPARGARPGRNASAHAGTTRCRRLRLSALAPQTGRAGRQNRLAAPGKRPGLS